MSIDPKYDIEKIKRENAALRKYAALQDAAEEKIGCQKIYVDIAGGIPEAFILDELIYFTLPRRETGRSGLRVRKDGVLWMAVSRTEWWDRKRLTAKEADGAIERLVKKNLIFKNYFLFNKQKTTHLRLNVEAFFRLYSEELEKRNPPEDESDTVLKDIHDLYEMMGIPFKDTPEGVPDGEAGILKRNKVSLNGDSFNNPHTTSTTTLNDDDEESARQAEIEAINSRTQALKNLYEGNVGPITPLMIQILRNAAIDYPNQDWYEPAFTVMVKSANHRNWSFVDAVLKGWKEHYFGWKPEFKEKGVGHDKKRNTNNSGSSPTGLSPEDQRTADAINKRRAAKKAAMSSVQ